MLVFTDILRTRRSGRVGRAAARAVRRDAISRRRRWLLPRSGACSSDAAIRFPKLCFACTTISFCHRDSNPGRSGRHFAGFLLIRLLLASIVCPSPDGHGARTARNVLPTHGCRWARLAGMLTADKCRGRDRAGDLQIFILMLSQLSYRGFDIVEGGQQVAPL
jgi:hypothetical protein